VALTATGLAIAVLLTCPWLAQAAGQRSGEGRVLAASGQPLLIETSRGPMLVAIAPGASLVGLSLPRDLEPGDLVRFRWSREVAGVVQAEALERPSPVRLMPEHLIQPETLAEQLASPSPPLLLDARPAARLEAGRLPGARTARSAEPPGPGRAARGAAVVCGEDDSSEEAPALVRRLLSEGWGDVRLLSGGVRRWSQQGRPLLLPAAAAAARLGRAPGMLVVDVRPRGDVSAGAIPGAVSIPPEALRLKDFDGLRPVLPVLLVGAGEADPTPAAMADRLRLLRGSGEGGPPIETYVLEGGYPAWRRAGLPVERGSPRTDVPFRPLLQGELDPAEFARLWQAQGGREAVFLDVRRDGIQPQAWARHIPLEELATRLDELPRDRRIVVFCTFGVRSRVAHELLRRNGFQASFLRSGNPL
jgi:rhodanese-related sulfurtransferase